MHITINFEGVEKLGKMAKVTTLWHTHPTADNSADNPNEVVPQITELPVKGAGMDFKLKPNF